MAIRDFTGNDESSRYTKNSATSGFLNITGGNTTIPDLIARKNQKSQTTTPVYSKSGSNSNGGGSSNVSVVNNSPVVSSSPAVTTSGSNDYQNVLAQMYAQQQAQAAALQAQQRAAAQNAYNAGMSRLNDAWNAKQNALRSNLNSTLSNLGRQYDTSKNEVTDDANKSLREAYVNYMLNKKNLNQNLTARGVGGGAAESTIAGMYNNYGNSRNGINETLNDNLTSLESLYQSNVANANQQYNSAYADALSQYMNYQSQMEQNLANSIVGSYGDMISSLGSLNSGYTSALSRLLENQQAYEYERALNTLKLDQANTKQENNLGTITEYAKYISSQRANGVSDEEIVRNLKQQGLDMNTVAQLFSI